MQKKQKEKESAKTIIRAHNLGDDMRDFDALEVMARGLRRDLLRRQEF